MRDYDLYEDLNDPDLLDDTPIGKLRVVHHAGAPCVVVLNPHDEDAPGTLIYTLKPGENPLNAIPGRRHFEMAAVLELYAQRDRARDAALERERTDSGRDLRRELKNLANRRDDAEEGIGGLLGMPAEWEDPNALE